MAVGTPQPPAKPVWTPLDDAAEALFKEAHQRARRRHRRQAAGLIAALLLIAAGIAIRLDSGGGERPTGADQPEPPTVPSEHVLAREPYMGVSCRRPNSIACDRVGLAVWTRRPARAVRATIAGRTFELDDPEYGSPRKHGLRLMFAGYLHDAGLRGSGPLAVKVKNNRWFGGPVATTVRLIITDADGSQRATTVRVALAAGWG